MSDDKTIAVEINFSRPSFQGLPGKEKLKPTNTVQDVFNFLN